jgi:cell wall-associated NlpC family hydrolase
VAPGAWRSAVNAWLGVPYRYGGTDRRGIDCSGFTRQLYHSVAGLDLPHNTAAQIGLGAKVARVALRPGDLVFFSEPGRGVIHVGLSLGSDQFAHASVRRGVIISSLGETYYAIRWCGARRLLP